MIFSILVCFLILKPFTNGFQSIKYGIFSKHEFTLYSTTQITTSITETAQSKEISSLIKSNPYDSKLSLLLDTMPEPEKYDILLQSYGSSILESSERNITLLKTMTSLYSEMLQKSIKPTNRATKSLIDAGSKFGSCDKLGRILQLAKASSNVRAYGVANGRLLTPILTAENADFLPALPTDDRELEVIYATAAGAIISSWLFLQALSIFDDDFHSWATILAGLTIAIGTADITARSSQGIKTVIAGIDRLVLKDDTREMHGDSAAFLLGYLLGLPCFCFRPDVPEALKMFLDHRPSMDSYRQTPLPTGRLTSTSTSTSTAGNINIKSKDKSSDTTSSNSEQGLGGSSAGFLQNLFTSIQPSMKGTSGASSSSSSSTLMIFTTPTPDFEYDTFGIGRILVWLMAPVAAEMLKYGKTVTSDPRRPVRFLTMLDEIMKQRPTVSSSTSSTDGLPPDSVGDALKIPRGMAALPPQGPDRDAFLRWAYYEATVLVQQNGDLLEAVRSYLNTGTTTVGECVLLVETELQG